MNNQDKNGWRLWEQHHQNEDAAFLKQLWDKSGNYKSNNSFDAEAGFGRLSSAMQAERPSVKVVPMRPRRQLLRIAAGVALLVGAVLVFQKLNGAAVQSQTIAAKGEGTESVVLPDGSEVTLNAGSEITFDNVFSSKERKVLLKGEAFFEVQRNEDAPFLVETQDGVVTVLGTSFNVRSVPNDSKFEVFVKTGKVRVQPKGAKSNFDLKPGEFIHIDRNTNKAMLGIDEDDTALAWKTGVLNFKGRTVQEVLKGIGKLYGTEFNYDSKEHASCLLTLSFEKDKLDEAIDAIKLSCPNLSIAKQATNSYSVKGNCCQ